MFLTERDDPGADRLVLVVIGDVDLAAAPDLRSALHAAARDGRPVLLDLSGCTFLDSVGVGLLLGASRRCTAGLRVLPSDVALALLEATGVAGVLDLVAAPT